MLIKKWLYSISLQKHRNCINDPIGKRPLTWWSGGLRELQCGWPFRTCLPGTARWLLVGPVAPWIESGIVVETSATQLLWQVAEMATSGWVVRCSFGTFLFAWAPRYQVWIFLPSEHDLVASEADCVKVVCYCPNFCRDDFWSVPYLWCVVSPRFINVTHKGDNDRL